MYINCEPRRGGLFRGTVLVPVLAMILAGCSTLPASGPTGREIRNAAVGHDGQLPFAIVPVENAAALPAPPAIPMSTLATLPPPPTDTIGPGDTLDIAIYEAGVTLFGNTGIRGGGSATTFDPAARVEKMPEVRVDDAGNIRLPFVGRLRVAGRTTAEVQSMIRASLLGMSQDPHVMVSIADSITNSVILAGEVTKPGRLVLATNRESLVDTLALAGGYKGEAKDIVARVQRKGRSFEIRLSDLLSAPEEDLQIAPGDRITLMSQPQSFSVLGAPNRAEEVRFPRARVTLAEAVAISGGVNPNQGDAAAIFVFRYVVQPDGTEVPMVYHLNMMRAGAYFLSQRFMMRDQDILYIGNAQANQPTKMVQLVSQLFVPVTTVRTTLN